MGRRRKQEEPEGDQTTRNHNAKHVKKVIAEAAGEIIRLKGEKSAIQELIAEQRGRIKSLGIKAAEFNVALRYYELEREDRAGDLDNLKVCFEALGMGEQLDWIAAKEKGAEDGDGDVRPGFLRNREAAGSA